MTWILAVCLFTFLFSTMPVWRKASVGLDVQVIWAASGTAFVVLKWLV